ncbi:MAG: hypothetical protein COX30_02135 [Candidatus Moranbacteria bacterium CG23_combo_of_CG06-09_8_20_14_all_39_10]|nr:MAG: hypothetical protein COX30_02135 [Candidatus Moranbacteria bacterium CG23_combo_of_CG06-09_8_20_14_all_39_10]
MSKLFKILAVAVFFLILPVATKACDVRLYAKSYMNRISTVVGGKNRRLLLRVELIRKDLVFMKMA